MPDDLMSLIHEARRVAGVHTDVDLARLLGISRRTVLRHHHQGGISSDDGYNKLIAAVHARDPDLARRLARALRKDLAELGLGTPVTPSAKPPANADHLAAVLVTASDAFGMVPREARPALQETLEKIRDLGVDLDQLIALLAEPPKSKKA
jgi:hypothetical protein